MQQQTLTSSESARQLAQLIDFMADRRRLLVLTGAGCSTDSGIPAYRDEQANWQRKPPMFLQEFLGSQLARQRYWARSLLGWPAFAAARPNAAHLALAQLERQGRLHWLITQNVDGLHRRAGSERISDLHGRLDTVECLNCGLLGSRAALQEELLALNPDWGARTAALAPDGDAELEAADFAEFRVPDCPRCGGLLKPAVVFFGEQVPRARVAFCLERLREADGLLVVGSSLAVWSGYRFVRAAVQEGKPVALVNLGRTRADAEATLKLEVSCSAVLPAVAAALAGGVADASLPAVLAPQR